MDSNAAAPSSSKKAITDPDEGNLVWDEYKYCHDLIWRHLIRSTLALVALMTIGYSTAFSAPNNMVALAAVTAVGYAIITFLALEPELRILQKIKQVHRSRQANSLGIDWDPTPQAGDGWGRPFLVDGFGRRVAVYLILLLLTTVVAGWMACSDPNRSTTPRTKEEAPSR
jgi:hypothetical protein